MSLDRSCHSSLIGLLALTVLAACTEPTQTVRIPFSARLDGEVVSCGEDRAAKHYVEDLRLYVSDLYLLDATGERVPVELDQARPNQHGAVALVSLIWPGQQCEDDAADRSVVGRVAAGRYTGLGFSVGLPFELNHLNPLTAPPPLNVSSMFWTWQLGYKFLRLDLVSNGEPPRSWSLHLGSTGCESPSSVRPPASPCARANQVQVELERFEIVTDEVIIDIDRLLEAVEEPLPASCIGSFHRQPLCRNVLTRLGIEPDSGQCIDDCAAQQLFGVGSDARVATTP